MSSDDEIVVVGDSTVNECETKKRKQSDISSFFGGAGKQKKTVKNTSSIKTSQPAPSSRILHV